MYEVKLTKYECITILTEKVMMTLLLIFVICWNPVHSTYGTLNDSTDETPCPTDENKCNGICYSMSEKVCLDDKVLCNIGEELCYRKCYNPENGAKCYNNYTLCQAGKENCGYDCFDVESGAKCYNGVTLCQANEENCGDECYDTKIEKCFDNKQVCLNNREPCGDYRCYWPHNETCFEQRKGYPATACPKGFEPCGYECFDPKENACLEYETGNEQKAEKSCPLRSGICGNKCYKITNKTKCVEGVVCRNDKEVCGNKCYIPSVGKKCVDGVLCLNDQSSCGQQCYIATNDTVCDNGVICKTGEFGCNGKCYNSTTRQVCSMRTSAATVTFEDADDYIECEEGYAVNVNGDCQRVMHFENDFSREAEGEDFDQDDGVSNGSLNVMVNRKIYYILVSFLCQMFNY